MVYLIENYQISWQEILATIRVFSFPACYSFSIRGAEMPLLCYDPRHLGLITTPSLHAFCKTAGHQVKVQEHLQILQPEGPASPPWLRVGLSFRELAQGGKIPLSVNAGRHSWPQANPVKRNLVHQERKKIVKHCPDFPPQLKTQMSGARLRLRSLVSLGEQNTNVSKDGNPICRLQNFQNPKDNAGHRL